MDKEKEEVEKSQHVRYAYANHYLRRNAFLAQPGEEFEAVVRGSEYEWLPQVRSLREPVVQHGDIEGHAKNGQYHVVDA